MRRFLRWLSIYVAGGLLFAIVFGVVSEFFIELAREKGWYAAPSQRLDALMTAFNSFVTQPWFISLTMLIVGLALGLWADRLLRRPERVFTGSHEPTALQHSPSEVDDEALANDDHASPEYKELLDFFLDHLEPVADAQLSMQRAILCAGLENEKVRSLAAQSLHSISFHNSISFVSGCLGSSPPTLPTLYQLEVSIHNAEFTYKECIEYTEELARSLGLQIHTDQRLLPLWEEWRVKHNAMKAAYEKIKRKPQFGKLFRPLRESRWGEPIPPYQGT